MATRKLNKKEAAAQLFRGAQEYYAKYRPGIPAKVMDVIIRHFGVKRSDWVLDIGCGTGQVALAMNGRIKEMVCFDPDPEMLKQARRATKKTKIKLIWINCGIQDLKKIKSNIGTFKIATICRTFHWLNQKQVLKDLGAVIDDGGGVAIFGDSSIWTGTETWQAAVRGVVQKYLGKQRRAGSGMFKQSEEPWEKVIVLSDFNNIKTRRVSVVRNWNVENIIGWLLSSSFARPDYFGKKLADFKIDVRKVLLAMNSKGNFKERAVFSIIMASRERR